MKEGINSYSEAASRLGLILDQSCTNKAEVTQHKHHIKESYSYWGQTIYDKAFLNWGLWDKQIYDEYQALNFNFSTLCNLQDMHSPLLLYYLIRSLISLPFFNKRLLDVGCGNGIGLKMSSELLHTQYALGVDLVSQLVNNANRNFYIKGKIQYIQADSECLPLEDGSFDIITNLESSHLYPQIEHFFCEVARILTPRGFFCYADINIDEKQQASKIEYFIKNQKNLKIIQKVDLTKMVQTSIYKRLIANEALFYQNATAMFGDDPSLKETYSLARAMGLAFLPWWRIWFKQPILKSLGREARQDKTWGKKYFFYYLIQKI